MIITPITLSQKGITSNPQCTLSGISSMVISFKLFVPFILLATYINNYEY